MGAHVQSEPGEQRTSYVYELLAAHDLPEVDLSKSFCSAFCCLNSTGRPQPSAAGPSASSHGCASTKIGGLLVASHLVGVVFCTLVPWLPAEYGRPIAIAAVGLALPKFLVDLRPVRYDIMLLLVKTYDFWYFVSVSTISCTLLALYLDDERAIIVLMPWMRNLRCALEDANTLTIRQLAVTSIVSLVMTSAMMICVQFQLVDATKSFVITRYRIGVLSVEDVILDGLATHLLLLFRNTYRRIRDSMNQQPRSSTDSSQMICISYRCTEKLQLVREVPSSQLARGAPRRSKSRPPRLRNSSRTQMSYVKEDPMFDAADMFAPIQFSSAPWPKWQQLMLRGVMISGLLLPSAAASPIWSPSQRKGLYYTALACSQIYCSFGWWLSQKQLYLKIICSFDYFFVSFQLASLFMCACDMFSWGVCSVGIINLWVWMHFVITSDALTPVMRTKLGFSAKFLAAPVVLFLAFQVAIISELYMNGDLNIQDRKLFQVVVGSRRIEFRVVPFFFGRLGATIAWSFRLLWRVLHTKDDQVVLLRGKVVYELEFLVALWGMYLSDLHAPARIEAIAAMAEVSSSPSSSLQEEKCLYILVASAPLPSIDLSRSVRSACLSPRAAAKLASLLKKLYTTIHLLYFSGVWVSILACFLPAKTTRVLATVALIGIPGTTGAIAVLRYDIILLLMWTYEFWYFTLTNFASCVLLAMHFADSRALIVPMLVVGTMSSILIDANMAVHRQFVVASMFVLCFFVVLLVYVAFHMVDDAQEFVLFRLNNRSLSVQDALVNGWGTIVVLTIRNIYRKRAALKNYEAGSTVVQCISYRCRVKLVRVQSPSAIGTQQTPQSSVSSATIPETPVSKVKLTPMHFTKVATVFCAKNMLVLSAAALVLDQKNELALARLRLLMFSSGAGSLLLGILSFAIEDPGLVCKVQIGAFICTMLFCGICASMYQRQLLQHLIFSFDFAFLTFQLTFVHLCVCELVSWDSRCFVVWSSWLWMHWVIGIDALTPQVKQKLRLQARFALSIVALFVLCQIAIGAEILFNPSSKLQDRVMYEHALNSRHSIQFRVIPFLLSRLLTLFTWSLRIQWRLWTLKAGQHELVIVQGGVTYNHAKKPPRSKWSRKSLLGSSRRRANVVPTAAPTL